MVKIEKRGYRSFKEGEFKWYSKEKSSNNRPRSLFYYPSTYLEVDYLSFSVFLYSKPDISDFKLLPGAFSLSDFSAYYL
jgi:hypothetical protein